MKNSNQSHKRTLFHGNNRFERRVLHSIKRRVRQKVFEFSVRPAILRVHLLTFWSSTAPYVFTKILKPVVARLKSQGHLSIVYLDNLLLARRNFKECEENVRDTLSLLQKLGFLVNKKKCNLVPSRRCKYLAFWFDSEKMSIELTDEKKERIKKLITKYRSIRRCKIRHFTEFVGTVVAYCPAVKYGLGNTKIFERTRYLALKENKGCYDKFMNLSVNLNPI